MPGTGDNGPYDTWANNGVNSNANATFGQMPNYDKAKTPIEKFTKYSLNPDSMGGHDKAVAYEKGLGYNLSNAKELSDTISKAVTSGKVKPHEIETTPYGVKYKYRIPITGPNGKTKNVIAVYQIDKGSSTPRLVTNYLESKKRGDKK